MLRGAIGSAWRATKPRCPSEGVVANLNLTGVDADAWSDVTQPCLRHRFTPGALNVNDSAASLAYLPTSLAVRARELTLGGRKFNRVGWAAGARAGLAQRGCP